MDCGQAVGRALSMADVLGVCGDRGLPRGGDSKSTLDMQTAADESCFRPLKTRAAHAASLRLCLLSLVLLKPTNKLVANVIDAT
jgi:hypothetical protein